jgi:hypothetical protein
MTVVEQIRRASGGRRFLHDDYSHISHFKIDVPIDVEVADGHRREDGAGGEGEHLVIVTKCFGVGEEQIVGELIF